MARSGRRPPAKAGRTIGRASSSTSAEEKARRARAKKRKEAEELRKREEILARKRLKDAAARQGIGKVARRLDAKLADVKKWLGGEKIPRKAVPEALTLNVGGGSTVTIKGSKLSKVTKLGAEKLANLTGLPAEKARREISRGKKKPEAPVRFKRSAIQALVKRVGEEKAAERLGTTPARLRSSLKPPRTAATGRLTKLIERYGIEQAASFLGLPESRLERWLEAGVPRAWEGGLNRAIGVTSEEFPAADQIKARPTLSARQLARQITSARKKVDAWNAKAPPTFRIKVSLVEQWIRLGSFDENFADVKRLEKEARKPAEPRKRPPKAPPLPPAKPLPTLEPEKPLPPPRARPPSKVVQPPPEAASAEALNDFLQLRYEYWANGGGTVDRARKRLRDAPWGRAIKARVADRQGYVIYGRVQDFVHNLDLDNLARKMISEGRRMWARLPPDRGIMSYRATLAGQGSGNPFYKDAWTPDRNKMEWFRLSSVTITDPRDIEHAVRSLLEEIYVLSGEMLLFFEHYEIARSMGI